MQNKYSQIKRLLGVLQGRTYRHLIGKFITFGFILSIVLLLTSCYIGRRHHAIDASEFTQQQLDSLEFATTHHYSENYNFVVSADSLSIYRQQPEEVVSGMMVDSFSIKKGSHLVVADIKIMPSSLTGNNDSIWVEVATEMSEFGWLTETNLLPSVVPDDPISQFISLFSNNHLVVFLIIFVIVSSLYFVRTLYKGQSHLVHFRDISSFYPTLLTTIVASAATFYASIQLFAPDAWEHFYFHPSLNPFSHPLLLGVFIASVWAMLIVAIACVDESMRLLPLGDAALYLAGLAAVCAINYVVFSLTTLYYIGYPLLLIYIIWAWRCYMKQ